MQNKLVVKHDKSKHDKGDVNPKDAMGQYHDEEIGAELAKALVLEILEDESLDSYDLFKITGKPL